MAEKIYLHPILERVWHAIHAICIVVLIISGAQIHWPGSVHLFGSFQTAVSVHNWFGLLLVADFLLWLIYNLVSRRIIHYIPNKRDIPNGLIVQAKFYICGIFKHDPHPYPPTVDEKFNPLQKMSYLMFMGLMTPILLISGILYLYPLYFADFITSIGGLKVLAVIHFILAIIFAAFLIAHLYLATTGHTIQDNFISIVTGYADSEEEEEEA